jgi:hypothetical protein
MNMWTGADLPVIQQVAYPDRVVAADAVLGWILLAGAPSSAGLEDSPSSSTPLSVSKAPGSIAGPNRVAALKYSTLRGQDCIQLINQKR